MILQWTHGIQIAKIAAQTIVDPFILQAVLNEQLEEGPALFNLY